MTVDGLIADPDVAMDAMVWDWDDELKGYVEALTAPVDGILLGRRLVAEGFIRYWADVSAKPEHPDHASGVRFTDTPKDRKSVV